MTDRLTSIEARAASDACGTCRNLAAEGKPIEHQGCAARATLRLAPDQPDYEDLVDLTDDERAALPARFHMPHFDDLGQPNAWLCRVCWGDGWVAQWPCATAQKHGAEVFTPDHVAEREQKWLADQFARIRSLVDDAAAGRVSEAMALVKILAALDSGTPPDGPAGRRRRIYNDGEGAAWVTHRQCLDIGEVLAKIDPHALTNHETADEVRERTGGLREIGRTW